MDSASFHAVSRIWRHLPRITHFRSAWTAFYGDTNRVMHFTGALITVIHTFWVLTILIDTLQIGMMLIYNEESLIPLRRWQGSKLGLYYTLWSYTLVLQIYAAFCIESGSLQVDCARYRSGQHGKIYVRPEVLINENENWRHFYRAQHWSDIFSYANNKMSCLKNMLNQL